MLRIYGSARSRATRTLWMAEELGLKYEPLDYAPRSPATRTPEYLALNPKPDEPEPKRATPPLGCAGNFG